MNADILLMYEKYPEALSIYEGAEAIILAEFPDVRLKVGKTQVGIYNKRLFAALWPPTRRFAGNAATYVGLTFGLGRLIEHPRIVGSVEPYPNRFTHHLLIARPEEIDGQVIDWLKEAYWFALNK